MAIITPSNKKVFKDGDVVTAEIINDIIETLLLEDGEEIDINIDNGTGEGSLIQKNVFNDNMASFTNSIALGEGNDTHRRNQFVAGEYNYANTEAIAIFGNGNDVSSRSNAMVVLKDGRIKIQTGPVDDDDGIRFIDLKEAIANLGGETGATNDYNTSYSGANWCRLAKVLNPSHIASGIFVVEIYKFDNEVTELLSVSKFSAVCGIDGDGKFIEDVTPLAQFPRDFTKGDSSLGSSGFAENGLISIRIENSDEGVFVTGLISKVLSSSSQSFIIRLSINSNLNYEPIFKETIYAADNEDLALTTTTTIHPLDPITYKVDMYYDFYSINLMSSGAGTKYNIMNNATDIIFGFENLGDYNYKWTFCNNSVNGTSLVPLSLTIGNTYELIEGGYIGTLLDLFNSKYVNQISDYCNVGLTRLYAKLTITGPSGISVKNINGEVIASAKANSGETVSVRPLIFDEDTYISFSGAGSMALSLTLEDWNTANELDIAPLLRFKFKNSFNSVSPSGTFSNSFALGTGTSNAYYRHGIEAELSQSYELYSINYRLEHYEKNYIRKDNIKTVNGQSLIGTGDISVEGDSAYLPLTGGEITGELWIKNDVISTYISPNGISTSEICIGENDEVSMTSEYITISNREKGTSTYISSNYISTPEINVGPSDEVYIDKNGITIYGDQANVQVYASKGENAESYIHIFDNDYYNTYIGAGSFSFMAGDIVFEIYPEDGYFYFGSSDNSLEWNFAQVGRTVNGKHYDYFYPNYSGNIVIDGQDNLEIQNSICLYSDSSPLPNNTFTYDVDTYYYAQGVELQNCDTGINYQIEFPKNISGEFVVKDVSGNITLGTKDDNTREFTDIWASGGIELGFYEYDIYISAEENLLHLTDGENTTALHSYGINIYDQDTKTDITPGEIIVGPNDDVVINKDGIHIPDNIAGLSNKSTNSAFGFNEEGVPCILNTTYIGRTVGVATDSLDGDYYYYTFPEKPGTIALLEDLEGIGDSGSSVTVEEVVEDTTNEININPNTYYNFDSRTNDLTITFSEGTSGILNEYSGQIQVDEQPFSITFPTGIRWRENDMVTISNNVLTFAEKHTYIFSVVNKLGLISEFANESLDAPVVTVKTDRGTIGWTAVENAERYSVTINDELYISNFTEALSGLEIADKVAEPGRYIIKVGAHSKYYTDSEGTATYITSAQLATPTNLIYDATNRTLSWDSVDNATEYYVRYRSDSETASQQTYVTTNYFQIPSGYLITLPLHLEVMAEGDGTIYLDSELVKLTYTGE